MDRNENEVLDCTLGMRRYILRTKQTAWNKSSGRIIVWSPCPLLPPSKKAKSIPVLRHYPQQYHQDVRFICTNEIEKDSCTVYKQQRIEMVPRPKYAHGVAIVDSLPGHDLNYKRGDSLWLYIKFQKPADIGTLTVPVINLETYETGTISIQHVCWFPHANGPSGELWTFGGMVSVVRGEKEQNWIWAVIQSRDGKTTTKCDLVEITPDCKIKFSERVALFKERLELMEDGFRKVSTRAKNLLPKSYLSILQGKTRQASPIKAIKRIFDDLQSSRDLVSTPGSPCSSSSSGQSSQIDIPPTKRRRLSSSNATTPEAEPKSRAHLPVSTPTESHSTFDYIGKSDSAATRKPDPLTVESVSWSLFSSKPLDKPFMAADEIARDPTLIGDAYNRARQHATSSGQLGRCGSVFCPKALESKEHVTEVMTQLAQHCSHENPKCPYTEVVPPQGRRRHIHLPALECHFNCLSGHLHCVALRDYPNSQSSGCLLKDWPAHLASSNIIPPEHDHTCCAWTPTDFQCSSHDIVMKDAKNDVHPSIRARQIVTQKGEIKILTPKVVDMSTSVEYPALTKTQLADLDRNGRLLSDPQTQRFEENYMKEKARRTHDSDSLKRSGERTMMAREGEELENSTIEHQASSARQLPLPTGRDPEIVAAGKAQAWSSKSNLNIPGDFPPNYNIKTYDNFPDKQYYSTDFGPKDSWTAGPAADPSLRNGDIPTTCDGNPVPMFGPVGPSNMNPEITHNTRSDTSYDNAITHEYNEPTSDWIPSQSTSDYSNQELNYLGTPIFTQQPPHQEIMSCEPMPSMMGYAPPYMEGESNHYGMPYLSENTPGYAIPTEAINAVGFG